MKIKIEVCCGSVQDCLAAQQGGADRIELNSALALGGLTPTLASLKIVKQKVSLPVIVMIRSRGAGFCYSEEEFDVMLQDAEILLDNGADGIAFGSLTAERRVNESQTRRMIELTHKSGREFVFHRAFDCTADPEAAIRQLIAWGTDRILTSGTFDKAEQGLALIASLQKRYGEQIEILAGSGVNAGNARQILQNTKITQLHSSCKTWTSDPTTSGNQVSYAYAPAPHQNDFDGVSAELVRKLTDSVH